MRLALIAAAAIALANTAVASAEDLVATPVDSWEGFYAGIHGGYGLANRNGCGDIGFELINGQIVLLPPPDPIESCDGAPVEATYDYDQQGGLAGFQFGYNWTPSENLLVGVEVSGSGASITGELDGLFGGVATFGTLATATAKAGVTFENFLVYGEAGVGMATANFLGDYYCDFTATHTGPVAGGGVSFKVADNAFIDLKYNHVWLGAAQSSCTSEVSSNGIDWITVPTEVRAQGSADIFKVGLNFQMDR